MRARRSVTLAPIGQPSRILKVATDLRDLRHQRLLAGDLGHVADGVVHDLLVGHGLAHAHVERDLGDLRHLHQVRRSRGSSMSFGTIFSL